MFMVSGVCMYLCMRQGFSRVASLSPCLSCFGDKFFFWRGANIADGSTDPTSI